MPFTAGNGELSWTVSGPQGQITQKFSYRFNPDGALILTSPEQGENIYLRASRFLPVDAVAGRWQSTDGGELKLEKNGQLSMGENVWGSYRLWKSGKDTMLTQLLWIQGEGSFMVIGRVKVSGDEMTLTPMPPPGESMPPIVYKRVK